MKLLLTSLLSIVLLFPAEGNGDHDFYVSICDVEIKETEKVVEVALKVFTDDLASCLKEFAAEHLIEDEGNLLNTYLKHHFNISYDDDRSLTRSFVGQEEEGESTWLYLEFKGDVAYSGLRISNDVFMNCFEKQTNILHIKAGKNKKSFYLTSDKPTCHIKS